MYLSHSAPARGPAYAKSRQSTLQFAYLLVAHIKPEKREKGANHQALMLPVRPFRKCVILRTS